MRPSPRPLILLCTSLLLSQVIPREGAAQVPGADGWRSDLTYLLERLPLRHPDPWHTVSEEEFRAEVRRLRGRLESLEEHERLVGLARLMARIGDGHTMYPLLWDDGNGLRRYPLELVPTEEGALVLSAAPGREELLGADVLSLDGRPLGQALAAVLPLDARDHRLGPHMAHRLVAVPEVLHAVGVARSPDSVRVELRMPSGDLALRTLRAVLAPEVPPGHDYPPGWRLLGGAGAPLWLRHRDDAFWLEPPDGSGTVYVQYNDASVRENDAGESLVDFTDRLLRLVRSRPVERVVVDLRWNDGGSAWISRTLLQGLVEAERALGGRRTGRRGEREPSGRLFVLVGPGTFSAGTLLAAELEWHTDAVFVGQPTGGRPNAYGETGRFRLPETGYAVRTSIAYMQGTEAGDHRPAIFPDVPVRYRARDFRAGVDPALEAVRAWTPGGRGEDRLVEAYRDEGLDAALEELRRLEEGTLSVDDAQLLLFRLASHLEEGGRPDDALRALAAALERFPWAAWAWAGRARIHDARGEVDRAVESACRAYALDYYRTEMLDLLEERSALACARRDRRGRGRPTSPPGPS